MKEPGSRQLRLGHTAGITTNELYIRFIPMKTVGMRSLNHYQKDVRLMFDIMGV